MPVHFVLFDLDDVLGRYDQQGFRQRLGDLTGRTLQEVNAALYHSGFDHDADMGLFSAADHLAGIAARLGRKMTEADWVDARRAAFTRWPDMLDLVRAVKEKTRVGIFSNNSFLFRKNLTHIYPQLAELFGENILVSAELGLCKPAPQAFLAALQRLGAEPATTLFIDDITENAVGAERAGLKSHAFADRQHLSRRLRQEAVL